MPLIFSQSLLKAAFDQPNDALLAEIVANDHSCVCEYAAEKIYLDLETDELNDEVMGEIDANDPTSGYITEKIYLNPEKIIPTNQGLFLNLNDQDYVALPMLYSDKSGCYIKRVVRVTSTCPHCGREYLVACKNPDCPGLKKREEFKKEKKDKERKFKEKKDKDKKDRKKK